MELTKTHLYLILLLLVVFALVSANELGYGAIALLPGLLIAFWLMTKVFTHNP
jgi:hypothetical protein